MHRKLHKCAATPKRSNPGKHMPLKKRAFSDDEIAIFDDAVIYKRGEYWHFRMWLAGEGKYARKSLRTRSRSTAIEKGKEAYLEIYANAKAGKTYFSITAKEGVDLYVKHRAKDVESGVIVSGRLTTIKTHLQHWLTFIGKDTKLKELERTDCEDYFHHRAKQNRNIPIKQVTVQNEQSTVNAMMKWLFRNNETHIDAFEFKKLPRIDHRASEVRRSTLEQHEFDRLQGVMRDYCMRRKHALEREEWLTRQIVRHYVLIAAASGLRVGEQRQLRWRDIENFGLLTEGGEELQLATISVRASTSKVRTSRRFHCRAGELFSRLRRLLKPANNDCLVFSIDGKETISKRAVLYHFHRMIKLCELEETEERDIVPYSLRHYFITQKIMAGLSFRQITDMCGTSVAHIEKTYYHVNDDIMLTNALADYAFDAHGRIEVSEA